MTIREPTRVFAGNQWVTLIGHEPGIVITETDFGVGESWPVAEVQVPHREGSQELVLLAHRYPRFKTGP